MGTDTTRMDFDVFRDAKTLIALLLFIFGFFSRTVEVFIRKDFGERYFSYTRLVMSFALINFFTFMSSTVNPLTRGIVISGGLLGFSYLFLAVGGYHKFVMIMRAYRGDYSIHSYEFGTQWAIWERLFPRDGFFQKMFPVFTYRFVEPAFVFFVGAVIAGFDTALGQYIMFSAFCLFMGMLTFYRMELTRFLDQNDAQLVAEGRKTSRFGNVNLRPAAGKGKSAPKLKEKTSPTIHPIKQGTPEDSAAEKTKIAKEWT